MGADDWLIKFVHSTAQFTTISTLNSGDPLHQYAIVIDIHSTGINDDVLFKSECEAHKI
jgi:hypothetical protein